MTDSFISKFPKCKLVIPNVIKRIDKKKTRKDKTEIDKIVDKFNIRLSKFCKTNKIDSIDYKNLDATCLNYKKTPF